MKGNDTSLILIYDSKNNVAGIQMGVCFLLECSFFVLNFVFFSNNSFPKQW